VNGGISFVTTKTDTPAIDRVLLAKAAAEHRSFMAKMERLQHSLADIDRRIGVIEKQGSAVAVQPNPPELASWSPERLAAIIAAMPADELAKLRQ
jgi:hypothetical protein